MCFPNSRRHNHATLEASWKHPGAYNGVLQGALECRDQHLPVLPIGPHSVDHALAPALEADPAARAAGARVDRVGQHVVDRVVDWQLPNDPPTRGDRVTRPTSNRNGG